MHLVLLSSPTQFDPMTKSQADSAVTGLHQNVVKKAIHVAGSVENNAGRPLNRRCNQTPKRYFSLAKSLAEKMIGSLSIKTNSGVYDLVMFKETWLNTGTLKPELATQVTGYEILLRVRMNFTQDGILV